MILYYLVYPFIIIFSLLPFSVLYFLSDIVYFITYYLVGYRRKVVITNLTNSFPEKDRKEIDAIAKKFYRHFCDVMVETIKTTFLSINQLRKRVKFKNPEVFDKILANGKDVIVVSAHYGNWEWLIGVAQLTGFHAMTVYKPLNNKYFDRFFIRTRSKFGTGAIAMRSIAKEILLHKKRNIRTLSCLIADQSPMRSEVQYWTTFLHQDTPVYLGVEKLARQTSQAVVFSAVKKIKRGHYEVENSLLFEDASKTEPGQVTEAHVHKLEEIIREHPEYWLWTHRRWKIKRDIL